MGRGGTPHFGNPPLYIPLWNPRILLIYSKQPIYIFALNNCCVTRYGLNIRWHVIDDCFIHLQQQSS